MPNFIDLFGEEISRKRERFIQYLKKGLELKTLNSDYKNQFDSYFLNLDDLPHSHHKFEALAVDASGKTREFSNGTFFYLTRASGIINNGDVLRKLEANVFTLDGSTFEVNTYFGRKSENLEFKIIEEYIRSQEKGDKYKLCLVDGSLYSRLMSHIIESPVLGDETFIIDHFKKLFKVLKEAKDKNIILLGLSKDSRDTFFRNAILDEIYYENRKKIKRSLTPDEYRIIKTVIKEIDNPNESKVRTFRELIEKHPKILDKLEAIYREYWISRTDWEIIYRFSEYPGFTFPIEKGLGRPEQLKIFKNMVNKTQNYISNHFKKYLTTLTEKRKATFIKEASFVIKNLSDMPTFISFHILLDMRDNPIKVDIPSWYFKDWNHLIHFPFVKFVKGVDPLLKKLISNIRELYGGIENHNLLLAAAHEDAVLKNRIYDEVYENCLQDKLNMIFYHKRRIKRMKR